MKYINVNKIKKLLNLKNKDNTVQNVIDFINDYKLNTNRIHIIYIGWHSELLPFMERRKRKIRETNGKGGGLLNYVICDGKCQQCPSQIKCSIITKEEKLWV